MQHVIDALYTQNILLDKPVLEQNSVSEKQVRKYLQIIVRECIQEFDPSFSIKLRFLVARALLYIKDT
jgi:predicted NACHT family NTPase